ncbi:unnamed protein product [Protopolystoma xenopodis]|uniref:Uncharacterized protein n=1 Tax=Protopolystoma xenopodis TaxID=117903 RepID=A0A3S5BQT4_9PLAT|nr:unnamed protein product [Protopolystoma xenopodis]
MGKLNCADIRLDIIIASKNQQVGVKRRPINREDFPNAFRLIDFPPAHLVAYFVTVMQASEEAGNREASFASSKRTDFCEALFHASLACISVSQAYLRRLSGLGE